MDVTLRGIRKTYRGGIIALDRLDLDIPPGLFGLLGPNGAGKTTLMRILAGVSRPDRGSVRAGDWDLGRPRERRQFQGRLGYLPRDLGLYPELSGRRFLDYAGTLKGMSSPRRRHRRVDEVLHLTGLDAVADRPAGGYSGGMRRRLGVAQALLNDPAVLLLDEPTAGLDPQEQTRIRMLLASLAGQRTVVLATRYGHGRVEHLRTLRGAGRRPGDLPGRHGRAGPRRGRPGLVGADGPAAERGAGGRRGVRGPAAGPHRVPGDRAGAAAAVRAAAAAAAGRRLPGPDPPPRGRSAVKD